MDVTTGAGEAEARVPRDRTSAGAGAASGGSLGDALARACRALIEEQHADGHWCYELQADCTITSEYILLMHFMGELEPELQSRLANFLRDHQDDHGGWSLYPGGALDISGSVKAYWALKLAGDDPQAAHMRRAREAILEHGGAARSNVFTRIAMALFGEVPWRATPWIPVEILLLPRWFPFHIDRISYWSRTVLVPLTILCTRRPRAVNPNGVNIRELFQTPPENERHYFRIDSTMGRVLLGVERVARLMEPLIPNFVRRRATRKAEQWFVARLNGVDGLGGIFPAMVNAYEALHVLGYAADDPLRVTCRESITRLLVEQGERAYCQPCFSPVWDTALAALALQEARPAQSGEHAERLDSAVTRSLEWIVEKQIVDGEADWRRYRPDLPPGGWAFQYENPYYPDLDDTAVVGWALLRENAQAHAGTLGLACDWLRGMQSRNGGFAAFDTDNTDAYLNEIPFADHGALLDPPTSDVTARCIALFSRLGREADRESMGRGLDFLFREQEADGSWFGRWGTNYIYGTWSVLHGIEHVDDPRMLRAVDRAVAFLTSVQREDGAWGESNDSYFDPAAAGRGSEGTCVHTAWAVLALLSADQGCSEAVRKGVEWLLAEQSDDGLWSEECFNAPGFPRVFHLRYHGYARYFPLWALARYRRAQLEAQG